MNGDTIECVKELKYLDVIISRSGNYFSTREKIYCLVEYADVQMWHMDSRSDTLLTILEPIILSTVHVARSPVVISKIPLDLHPLEMGKRGKGAIWCRWESTRIV